MELHGRMAAVLDELPAILKVRIDGHKVDPRSLASCRLVAQMQISFQLHFHYLSKPSSASIGLLRRLITRPRTVLRLHRPVHTLLDVHAANVPFHREIVIRTARTLLSLRRVARIGPEAVLPGTFFVAAAVSLVVDGIQQPTRSNMASAEAAELRQEVDELLTDFLAEAKAPVLRRGKRVLEFLLGRFDAQVRFLPGHWTRPCSSLTERLDAVPARRRHTPADGPRQYPDLIGIVSTCWCLQHRSAPASCILSCPRMNAQVGENAMLASGGRSGDRGRTKDRSRFVGVVSPRRSA